MIVAADENLAGPLPKTGTSQVFVESEFTGLAIVEFLLPFVGSFFYLLLLFFCPLKLALVLRAQVSFARNEATPPPFWNTKETEQIIKLQSLTGWNSEGKKSAGRTCYK